MPITEPDEHKDHPTSLSSSFVRSPLVDTKRLNADEIILSNAKIKGVSISDVDTDPNYIVSSYALSNLRRQLSAEMRDFQQQLDNKQFSPVISDAIIPPYFASDSKWHPVNINYVNGQALYRNNSDSVTKNQALLKLANGSFPRMGSYFVRIEVPRLESGTITVSNQINEQLFVIDQAGTYSFLITIDNIDNFSLALTISDVKKNKSITINRIYIYYIEDRVGYYFNYINEHFQSGDGSGIASQNYVQDEITKANSTLFTQLSDLLGNTDRALGAHLLAVNPHGITPETIKAAPVQHTHTPEECGAAPTVHTHTADECDAAPVVHTHTPEECGAAPESHTHTPSECDAAPAVHTHVIADLTDGDLITNHLNTELNTNPHETTKEDVGLGNIENYEVASLDNFIERASDKYVTPEGACQFLDVLFSDDPTLKYVSYAPKLIVSEDITLVPENSTTSDPNPTYSITLKPNTTYMGFIDGKKSANMDCLGYYISKTGESFLDQKCMNSWILGTVVEATNVLRWSALSDTMFFFTPPNVGTNMLRGRLIIDTAMITTQCMGQGWLGTQEEGDVGNYLTNTGYPLFQFGSFKEWKDINEDTDTVTLTFVHKHDRNNNVNNQDCKFTLVLYELVAVGNNPNPVDPSPLLTRSKFLGTTPPLGWSIEDGSLLDRSLYSELADNIEKYNLTLSSADYDSQIESTGKCPYFVLTVDTIRLPTMPCEDVGSISIIKTSMKYI